MGVWHLLDEACVFSDGLQAVPQTHVIALDGACQLVDGGSLLLHRLRRPHKPLVHRRATLCRVSHVDPPVLVATLNRPSPPLPSYSLLPCRDVPHTRHWPVCRISGRCPVRPQVSATAASLVEARTLSLLPTIPCRVGEETSWTLDVWRGRIPVLGRTTERSKDGTESLSQPAWQWVPLRLPPCPQNGVRALSGCVLGQAAGVLARMGVTSSLQPEHKNFGVSAFAGVRGGTAWKDPSVSLPHGMPTPALHMTLVYG